MYGEGLYQADREAAAMMGLHFRNYQLRDEPRVKTSEPRLSVGDRSFVSNAVIAAASQQVRKLALSQLDDLVDQAGAFRISKLSHCFNRK